MRANEILRLWTRLLRLRLLRWLGLLGWTLPITFVVIVDSLFVLYMMDRSALGDGAQFVAVPSRWCLPGYTIVSGTECRRTLN